MTLGKKMDVFFMGTGLQIFTIFTSSKMVEESFFMCEIESGLTYLFWLYGLATVECNTANVIYACKICKSSVCVSVLHIHK